MQHQRHIRIERRPGNVIFQVAGVVLALIALMGAVVIGGFLLAGLIGIALVAWLVIFIRLWWLSRKLGSQAANGGRTERYVEAEYQVIDDSTETDQSEQ